MVKDAKASARANRIDNDVGVANRIDELVQARKEGTPTYCGAVKPIKEIEERFCKEYLKDKSPLNAALRAGYTPKHPGKMNSFSVAAWKRKERLLWRISQLEMETGHRTITVDTDYVVHKLLEMVELCSEARPVVDKSGKPVIVHDKKTGQALHALYMIDSRGLASALQMLGKYLGMYTDKVEVTDNGSLADKLSQARARASAATAAIDSTSNSNSTKDLSTKDIKTNNTNKDFTGFSNSNNSTKTSSSSSKVTTVTLDTPSNLSYSNHSTKVAASSPGSTPTPPPGPLHVLQGLQGGTHASENK